MPHALVTGDPQRFDQVRIRLEMLGLTVAAVDPATAAVASVGDCDLLVHVATARHSDVPRYGAGESPDAPMLRLGDPRPGSWAGVVWEDLDGNVFASAVRSCVDRAWELRGTAELPSSAVRYREFLAHELRSPLAVVVAALEALVAEPADDFPTEPEAQREILARALRNVRRLERTVDWSQRNLILAEAPPVVPRRVLSLADLAALLDSATAEGDTSILMETDPDLVAEIVQQMIRVCECLDPEARPRLRLVGRDVVCVVRLEIDAPADATDPLARSGLVRPGEESCRDCLVDLASLLIPAAALAGLEARLQGSPAEPGVLELHLPATIPVPA